MAMVFTSPPPTAKVVMVAADVAQPGQIVATSARNTRISDHGFHSRVKPVSAVWPVASV